MPATSKSKAPALDGVAVRAEIGRDRLVALHRRMLLIRRFEEEAEKSYRAKKIAGFLHLYIGQEALATAFYDHLIDGKDWSVTSYRCHAQALLAGEPATELMAELYGKATGNVRGKGGSMHFFSKKHGLLGGHGIVGGQIPVGTGAAFACKYRNDGGVSVSYFGDGASAQGTLHESLNMASLWDLPAIYVVENNRYGMGTACHRAVSVEDIAAAKAPGYNMAHFTCDGLDLMSTWKTAQQAVALARTNKPVLVEAKTYRYRGHSVSDAAAYRTKEEVDRYKALDPIERVRTHLAEAGWLDAAGVEAAEESVAEEVRAALAFAESSPEPDASELTTHVYA